MRNKQTTFLTLICSTFATLYIFIPMSPIVFYGDDLMAYSKYLDGQYASTIQQALTGDLYDKYRPILQLVQWCAFSLFGATYWPYMVLFYLCQLVGVTAFFLIATRLMGAFTAASITVMFSCLRFSYFNFSITGITESLALFFALMSMLAVLKTYTDETKSLTHASVVATAWFALAIHTHERFLAMAPWLLISLAISPIDRESGIGKNAVRTSLLLAIPIGFNLIFKRFILGSDIAMGSSGEPLTINLAHSAQLLKEGTLAIVGINIGHPFWVGHSVQSLSDPTIWSATVFILFVLVLMGLCLRQLVHRSTGSENGDTSQLRTWVFSLIILGGLMMIPPIMNVRMEQRWLVMPTALCLLTIGWISANFGPIVQLLALCSLGIFFVNDRLNMADFDNMYLFTSSRLANSLQPIAASLPASPRVDLALGDCYWVLYHDRFFKLYGKGQKTVCYNNENDWSNDPDRTNTLIIYDAKSSTFSSIKRNKF